MSLIADSESVEKTTRRIADSTRMQDAVYILQVQMVLPFSSAFLKTAVAHFPQSELGIILVVGRVGVIQVCYALLRLSGLRHSGRAFARRRERSRLKKLPQHAHAYVHG